MQAGASAHILKSAPVTELIAAIEHSIAAPLSFIGVGLARQLAAKRDNYSLTARELTILGYLKSGNENKEIAEHLFVTQSTVKTHLSSIYRKLEVDNRTQAVEFARKHALL
jgi:DNA-binding NarL/FixJ family response regulator